MKKEEKKYLVNILVDFDLGFCTFFSFFTFIASTEAAFKLEATFVLLLMIEESSCAFFSSNCFRLSLFA